MTHVDGSLMFRPDALVGFASGDDPIFEEYKKIIGKFHLTPKEAFKWHFDEQGTAGSFGKLSVIAYILPISEETKRQNYEHSKKIHGMPGERWANTRLYGEESNTNLQIYLIDELKKIGINAFSPYVEKKLFKTHSVHENGVWASNWSHRHMCFAAGLGSFGLSDGFISEKGIAHRCGSIIIEHELPSDASSRPEDPYEYCNNCGDCIENCPVNAISFENRHDKTVCSSFVFSTVPYINEHYKIDIYSCGFCQCNVSCSDGIPVKRGS